MDTWTWNNATTLRSEDEDTTPRPVSTMITPRPWAQRIALLKYNLQSATRTGDFAFFKALQAHQFVQTWCSMPISSSLGPDSETVLRILDDLCVRIAYIHQDAYKAIYDSIRYSIHEEDPTSRQAKIQVDVCQQQQAAEFGTTKSFNSAIALIENHVEGAQDRLVETFVANICIVADAMQVCGKEAERIREQVEDYIALEYSWQGVQSCVEASVAILRKVSTTNSPVTNNSPEAGATKDNYAASITSDMQARMSSANLASRRTSTASATSSVIKRLSSALCLMQPGSSNSLEQSTQPPTSSARASVSSHTSLSELRSAIENACPTTLPSTVSPRRASIDHGRAEGVSKRHSHDPDLLASKLSPIPATPYAIRDGANPFELMFSTRSPDIFDMDATPFTKRDIDPLDADPLASPRIDQDGQRGRTYGSMFAGAARRMSGAFVA